MLLQFSVNNFKSIKDTIVFSMGTSSKDKGNCFQVRNYKLLNSAVIYGANASGKSNILSAMSSMKSLVLNQTKVMQSVDQLPHEPFKLNIVTEHASSSFEIVCFINDIKYRYGFEFDNTTVYSEWLYADEKGKESKLFFRDFEENEFYVNPNKFKEGVGLKYNNNQLFIWKCDQEGGTISRSLLTWFTKFNFIDGIHDAGYHNFAMKQMENKNFKDAIVSLVKTADIGIEDIILEKSDVSESSLANIPLPEEIKQMILKGGNSTSLTLDTYHKKYDEKNNEIGTTIFDLNKEESQGTRKFFKMSAPILDSLKHGKVLMIDELDASLHPILTRHLINLFQDEDINKRNAQLIFVTHDTNLLTKEIFRRDQIWLTEKDTYGSTDLYSLAQFKNVRKNEDFEKQYIQGKYGAIPYLGTFDFEHEV